MVRFTINNQPCGVKLFLKKTQDLNIFKPISDNFTQSANDSTSTSPTTGANLSTEKPTEPQTLQYPPWYKTGGFDASARLCNCEQYCNLEQYLCVKHARELEEEKHLIRLDYATYKNISRMNSMKKEEMYEQELSKLIAENNRLEMILKKVENPVDL